MVSAQEQDTTNSYQEVKESKEGKFPVMEIFGPTIQGEGAMIGVRTMFIRMGGCDSRCQKCDSMHAVHPEAVKANAKWMTEEELVEEVAVMAKESNTEWVTLSGGNPVMWDFHRLIPLLQGLGFKVALETQGTLYRSWVALCDQVTISPKGPGMNDLRGFKPEQFIQFLKNYYNEIHWERPKSICIKVVAFGQDDFEFAVGLEELMRATFNPIPELYLSLGNSHPPVLGEDLELHEPTMIDSSDEGPIYTWARTGFDLPHALLRDYKILLEDYMQDTRLRNWRFLPQLHVLIWHNQSKV